MVGDNDDVGESSTHLNQEALFTDSIYRRARCRLEKYFRRSRQVDLDSAIANYQRALDVSWGTERRAHIRTELSNALRLRFDDEEREDDILSAIVLAREALSLTAEGDPKRPRTLRILAEALLSLSRSTPQTSAQQIKQAIAHLQEVIRLTEEEESDEAILTLVEYGWALQIAIGAAIIPDEGPMISKTAALEKALELTPPGHHLRFRTLYSLAILRNLFFHLLLGDTSGLDEAICMLQEASEILPKGHYQRYLVLTSLGHCLSERFKAHGELNDLDCGIRASAEAMGDCPPHVVCRDIIAGNYYESLFDQYRASSRLFDLDACIKGLGGLIGQARKGYRFQYTAILGKALVEAYAQYGKADFLDQAVDLNKAAIPEAPSLSLHYCYAALAESYHSRFLAHGYIEDLNEAVTILTKAQECCPHEGRRAKLQGDLGNILSTRFRLFHERVDLDQAIYALQQCIDYGFASKSFHEAPYYSLLGNALLQRYNAYDILNPTHDLDRAIASHEEAIRLLPNHHSFLPIAYSRLGSAYMQRFDSTNSVRDIEAATKAVESSVSLTPLGCSIRATYISQLGKTEYFLEKATTRSVDVSRILGRLKEATHDLSSFASGRFDAALTWASIAHQCNMYREATEGYRVATSLLPQVAWLGLDHRLKLQRLAAQCTNLCQDAAACAITLGNLEEAVEMLDRGRTIIWNFSLELRADLTDLHAINSTLARQMQETSAALDFRALWSSHPLTMDDVSVPNKEEEARSHRRLADRWQALVEEIRTHPSFKDFLKTPRFSVLCKSARGGTVVVINVSRYRCDALLLREDCPVQVISLPEVEISEIRQQAYMLNEALQVKRDAAGEVFLEGILKSVLKYLWTTMGNLVWDALKAVTSTTEPPRVWWCPTGPLALLPIHACGPCKQGEEGMADLVISSYTPRISALVRTKLLGDLTRIIPQPKLLAISLGAVPGLAGSELPSASEELDVIRTSSLRAVTFLQDSDATVSRVQELMREHSWFHIATHGIQQPDSPLQSCLVLYDGRLHLSTIASARLPNAEFAFLSACHSAKGDDTFPDEAFHVAGGLLVAGFKGVVGTQWSIADEDGPLVTRIFYSCVTGKDGVPEAAEAAAALHQATIHMRAASIPAWRWVPFVHLGL